MKPRKFPFSLGSCIAFEAAFRHGSFSRAAEELNLTQAAVSYQVRKLESDLGVSLFRRRPRPMTPTEAGRAFQLYVEQAFDILNSGHQAVSRNHARKRRLLISVAQSIGSKWLLPRLPGIQAAVPRHHVEIDLNDEVVDLGKSKADITVRYLRKGFPESDLSISSTPLFDNEQVFPVCAPNIADGITNTADKRDIDSVALLEHRKPDINWSDWFEQHGPINSNGRTAITFSHHSTMIDACIAGQGMCLGRSPLVGDDLKSGRLVRPFPASLASSHGYYILCLAERAADPVVERLIAYLTKQAAQSLVDLEALA